MALPMTIHEAKALAADDLAVDDASVADAEAEAAEAASLVEALERQAVESDTVPKATPAQTLEAKQLLDFARKRLDRTRQRADQAKAAQRLLALEAVGKDVEQIHADAVQTDAGMVAITNGYATLSQLADAHNARVRATIDRARELGAEPAAPSGPRASSAHVTVHTGRRHIQSGSAVVQQVDKRTIDDAVELAIKGDTDAAVRRLNAAHTVAQPKHADRYWRLPNGLIEPFNDQDPSRVRQAAKGEIDFLTDDQRAAYIDGRLDGHQAQA
jgi:hypothetical protein